MFRRGGRMSRRNPGAGGGTDVDPGFSPIDISGLVLWLRADRGITYVQGPVVATGTTPPTVTLSGTPASSTNSLEIDITTGGARGTALFTWKLNGVTQQTAQTTAATFLLGSTGITAAFATGTYATNDVYTSVVVVSAWADQSRNGNSVTQATGANQPTINASDAAYNGQPSLGFSGSPQFLATASMAIAQPMTLVVVGRTPSSGSANQGFLGSASTLCGLYSLINTSQISCFAGGAVSSAAIATTTSAMAAVINGASSAVYANGSTVGVVAGNAGANTVSGGLQVGKAGAIGSVIGGTIAEAMVYTGALTAAQIGQLFTYLGARYGKAWS